MAGWSYVVGRLPRGDLVYRCYLSFYKDSFYWEGSLEWWRQNFRLRVIPAARRTTRIGTATCGGLGRLMCLRCRRGRVFAVVVALGVFAYEGPLGVSYVGLGGRRCLRASRRSGLGLS